MVSICAISWTESSRAGRLERVRLEPGIASGFPTRWRVARCLVEREATAAGAIRAGKR